MADSVGTAGLPSVISTLLLRTSSQRMDLINKTLFLGSPLMRELAKGGAMKKLMSDTIRIDGTKAAVTTWVEDVVAAGTVTDSLAADFRSNLLIRHYVPAMVNSSMALHARELMLNTGEASIIDYLAEVSGQQARAIAAKVNGMVLSGYTATAGTAPSVAGLKTQIPFAAHVSSAKTVAATDHGGLFEADSTLLVPKRLVGQTITSATIIGLIRQMALGLTGDGRVKPTFGLSTQSAFLDLAAAMDGKFQIQNMKNIDAGIESIRIGSVDIICEGALDDVTIKSAVGDADTIYFLSPEAVNFFTASGASSGFDAGSLFKDSGNVITSATSVNHAVQARMFGQLVVVEPRSVGLLSTASS